MNNNTKGRFKNTTKKQRIASANLGFKNQKSDHAKVAWDGKTRVK